MLSVDGFDIQSITGSQPHPPKLQTPPPPRLNDLVAKPKVK